MANKITVTMYHPKATESIEVMLSEVMNAGKSGWVTEKPIVLKVDGVIVPEATDSFKTPIESKKPNKPKKKDSNQGRS